MSHEPHADDVAPGSTPGEGAGPNIDLERQRAEGDMPGRPTTAPRHAEEESDDDGREDQDTARVPPEQSVPEDVARDAARSADPADESSGGDDPVKPDDPMQRGSSTPDAGGVPRHEQ